MHPQTIRQEAKAVAASNTLAIVEMNNMVAVVTYKQPQRALPRGRIKKPAAQNAQRAIP